jgi:hypothetical protein
VESFAKIKEMAKIERKSKEKEKPDVKGPPPPFIHHTAGSAI